MTLMSIGKWNEREMLTNTGSYFRATYLALQTTTQLFTNASGSAEEMITNSPLYTVNNWLLRDFTQETRSLGFLIQLTLTDFDCSLVKCCQPPAKISTC